MKKKKTFVDFIFTSFNFLVLCEKTKIYFSGKIKKKNSYLFIFLFAFEQPPH